MKVALSHQVPWDMWEGYWLTVCVCRLQTPQDGFCAPRTLVVASLKQCTHSSAGTTLAWAVGAEHGALRAGLAATVRTDLTMVMAHSIRVVPVPLKEQEKTEFHYRGFKLSLVSNYCTEVCCLTVICWFSYKMMVCRPHTAKVAFLCLDRLFSKLRD